MGDIIVRPGFSDEEIAGMVYALMKMGQLRRCEYYTRILRKVKEIASVSEERMPLILEMMVARKRLVFDGEKYCVV